MTFFGDPETRGVKEDAHACVRMALAMQARIEGLAGQWRDLGLEEPLRARIGIDTGYCTAGNFRSEDRMDCTVIGGAVNLASRPKHATRPGGVLMSYDTLVHVRDEVQCEDRGHIQIRGFAYPVAIFEAVALEAGVATKTGQASGESGPCPPRPMSQASETSAQPGLKTSSTPKDKATTCRRRSIIDGMARSRWLVRRPSRHEAGSLTARRHRQGDGASRAGGMAAERTEKQASPAKPADASAHPALPRRRVALRRFAFGNGRPGR